MATDYATEKTRDAQMVAQASVEILAHFTGWRHDTAKESRYDANGWDGRVAFLTDGDRLLTVRIPREDTGGANRVEVVGDFTPERDDAYRQGFTRELPRPRITVAAERIDRVGIEVERRLLPKLDAANVTYRERVTAHDKYANAADANLTRLAAAIAAEPWENNSRDGKRLTWHYETPAGFGEAKAYDDSATLELHNLSVELAERILRMVRGAV